MARVQSVKLYRFTCGLETVQNFYLCVKRHVMPCHVECQRLHHLTFIRSKSLGSINGIHRSHTWKHATPLNLQTRSKKNESTFCILFVRGDSSSMVVFSNHLGVSRGASWRTCTIASEYHRLRTACPSSKLRTFSHAAAKDWGCWDDVFFWCFLGYPNVFSNLSLCVFFDWILQGYEKITCIYKRLVLDHARSIVTSGGIPLPNLSVILLMMQYPLHSVTISQWQNCSRCEVRVRTGDQKLPI